MNAMESVVRYGYLVIFGAVFAEQIGLPFPSEPFLLAGDGLAGSGRLSLVVAIGLAAIASLIGDTVWYWLGRTRGPSEQTSARAALLRKRGIERIRPLAGGYHGWRDRGYPMTRLATATSAAPATMLAMATQGGSHA